MLDTVGDYIAEARVLLQDTVATSYRNPDTEIKSAIGLGILEMRRLRPDLFVFGTTPNIKSDTPNATAIGVEEPHRLSLLYFTVGQVGLKDEEEGAEARSGSFMRSFVAKLLSVAA